MRARTRASLAPPRPRHATRECVTAAPAEAYSPRRTQPAWQEEVGADLLHTTGNRKYRLAAATAPLFLLLAAAAALPGASAATTVCNTGGSTTTSASAGITSSLSCPLGTVVTGFQARARAPSERSASLVLRPAGPPARRR